MAANDSGIAPGAAEEQDHAGELVIVTGMTGAGRSTAAKELEDLGFYVVDNLPPELVASLVHLVDERWGVGQPIAVVVDVRSGTNFDELRRLRARRETSRATTLLYLEASDDILIRRQDAARRPHPLQGGDRLFEGIMREREVMNQLRAVADLVIDTTKLNVNQLKARVAGSFGAGNAERLQLNVLSFGFKYGVPVDADLMADMRFLPNPFWVPELRDQTGQHPDVASYVKERTAAEEFLQGYVPVIQTVAAGYLREGKRHLTVAIGCTGGKHRSVAMTEELVRRLRDLGFEAEAAHRDLGRE